MPRRKDDILLKSAFEETFPDLLRFCFPDADDIFDMDKGFESLDKELTEFFPELEKQGGDRFVDMLVKVFLKNGTEEWILVHIEIQGTNDKPMLAPASRACCTTRIMWIKIVANGHCKIVP